MKILANRREVVERLTANLKSPGSDSPVIEFGELQFGIIELLPSVDWTWGNPEDFENWLVESGASPYCDQTTEKTWGAWIETQEMVAKEEVECLLLDCVEFDGEAVQIIWGR